MNHTRFLQYPAFPDLSLFSYRAWTFLLFYQCRYTPPYAAVETYFLPQLTLDHYILYHGSLTPFPRRFLTPKWPFLAYPRLSERALRFRWRGREVDSTEIREHCGLRVHRNRISFQCALPETYPFWNPGASPSQKKKTNSDPPYPPPFAEDPPPHPIPPSLILPILGGGNVHGDRCKHVCNGECWRKRLFVHHMDD
jgi:hypothetical protein